MYGKSIFDIKNFIIGRLFVVEYDFVFIYMVVFICRFYNNFVFGIDEFKEFIFGILDFIFLFVLIIIY